ncbi:MAG: Rho termination factor N-terminal domain-containing protein, partial [Mycobacterium sp.]
MTDTDLITAGGSTESSELPNTVSPDSTPSAERSAPAAERRGALTSMVLPELRAMAKEIGVEGASGMRKGELIAAIRERRGESTGRTGSEAKKDAPAETATTSSGPADSAGQDAPAGNAGDGAPPSQAGA